MLNEDDCRRIASALRALNDEVADARADARDWGAERERVAREAETLRQTRRETRRRLLRDARALVHKVRTAPPGRYADSLPAMIEHLRGAIGELGAIGGDTHELRRLLRDLEGSRRQEIESVSRPKLPATIIGFDLAGLPIAILNPTGR
jgi:hypothetical protein